MRRPERMTVAVKLETMPRLNIRTDAAPEYLPWDGAPPEVAPFADPDSIQWAAGANAAEMRARSLENKAAMKRYRASVADEMEIRRLRFDIRERA